MKNILLISIFVLGTIHSVFSQCQASFTYVVNGNTVDFTNTSSADSATASQFQWTFGDGGFSPNNDPSYTYTAPGTYQVCLLIVDFVNCPMNPTLFYCDSVTITGAVIPCQASFTYVVNGNTVDFTNTSSADSAIASQFQWTFGDGGFSPNNDPSYTYTTPGTYQVCLLIVDFINCPMNPTLFYCDSVTILGVGINDNYSFLNEVKWYPIPTKDNLQLNFTANEIKQITINFYNVIGELIESKIYTTKKGNNDLTFNVSKWNKGIYLVSINEESGKSVYRIKFLK